MTTGFHFDATCPRCAGELLPIDDSAVNEDPSQSSVEALCDGCMDLYRVTVTAVVVRAWPVDKVDPDAILRRARQGAAEGAVSLEPTW
mgnify:CR=1 FL=1